ncbi:low molecular weight phosphatase family protein [Corynebacterium halotolerans]|uniref:arsenate-mycothiol transferase ArsC n=1 Tax=Corynebacterium halotolerans TaxID=225326 RepID=UPI003CEE08AA
MSNRQFDIVREDMHRRYDHMCPPEMVDRVLDETISESVERARIGSFMTVMVEREATDRLEQEVAQGRAMDRRRKELLFVCRRNAGRSQLASALTRWLVGNRIMVRSVGLEPAEGVDPTVVQVLRERGISTRELYQKTIIPRTVHTSDVVVLMGVDEVPGVPGLRYVRWDIDDPEGEPVGRVRVIADEVERHIRGLLEELGVLGKTAA